MLEVILDSNAGNEFLREQRPVFEINQNTAPVSWQEYRQVAKSFFAHYAKNRIVIIRNNDDSFSINWFAVALFVESCLQDYKLEAVIFKVSDKQQALKDYAPFVALTIGIKFIITLAQENTSYIYKEIGNLGYLGLDIKQDYLANKTYLTLKRGAEIQNIVSHNLEQALEIIAFLKAQALSNNNFSFAVEINITNEENSINIEKVIDNIIERIKPVLISNP